MKCPYCNHDDTKVVDSRPVEDGLATRRRRECTKCHKRFTTFEKIENSLLVVVKKDGTRESFDKNKVINGIMKACQKTNVTYEDVQRIADNIERGLSNTMEKEIKSNIIGRLIMDELKNYKWEPMSKRDVINFFQAADCMNLFDKSPQYANAFSSMERVDVK